ncbi:hypothetical protein CJ030_MR6G023776 [Morella rubra]|uniref:Uncharacterized protein n=1 Tax=Morella rubra TaxID=262757 RepID=A0A6A1VAC5_9ROSI|nr:hypothetical protein CJ030_MR6G023776 [Morella rubra]
MASSGTGIEEVEVSSTSMGTLLVALWVSNHDQTDLAELRLKYGISSTIVVRLPKHKERVECPEGDEIAFFEDVLEARARFPLMKDIWQLLRWFSLSPTQLSPNSWRLALGFFALWEKLFQMRNLLPDGSSLGVIRLRQASLACTSFKLKMGAIYSVVFFQTTRAV